MERFLKYLKAFPVRVVLCIVLLLGQAVCDLCLPGLMGDTVQNGVRQSGLRPGAPEALNLQGMTLLKIFMTEQDKELMEKSYLEVRPGSSEAGRFGKRYPLVQEQPVSILRDDLDESTLSKTDICYNKAAYAFWLYLQQSAETGELEAIAGRYSLSLGKNPGGGEFGENIRVPQKDESSLPEGVLGSLPEGALFHLPETSEPEEESGMSLKDEPQILGMSLIESEPMEETAEMLEASDFAIGGDQPEEDEDVVNPDAPSTGTRFTYTPGQSLESIDLEEAYTLLPLLAHASTNNLKAARDAASENLFAGEQVGLTLKKLFYREVGMDTEKFRSDALRSAGLELLGVFLLEAACAVLVWLLLFWVSNGEQEPAQEVQAGLRGILYAPVILIGCVILALQKSPSMGWLVALGVFVALLVIALLLFRAQKRPEGKLFFGLDRWEQIVLGNAVQKKLLPFGMTVLMLFLNLVEWIALWAGGERIAGSRWQVGDIMAFFQYAAEGFAAFLLICALLLTVSRLRTLSGRMKRRKEKEKTR